MPSFLPEVTGQSPNKLLSENGSEEIFKKNSKIAGASVRNVVIKSEARPMIEAKTQTKILLERIIDDQEKIQDLEEDEEDKL